MAGLAKVAREMLLGGSTTVGKASMVTVIELVGAGH